MKITTCPEHSGSTNGTHTRTFTPTQGFVRVKYSASAAFSLANATLNMVDVDTVYTVLARGSYRYGFQGQERDDEIKGAGNSYNYEYRMHDPRLGRFFAIDPLTEKYPWYSSYQFSGNRVIDMVEFEGKEPFTIDLNANPFLAYFNSTSATVKLQRPTVEYLLDVTKNHLVKVVRNATNNEIGAAWNAATLATSRTVGQGARGDWTDPATARIRSYEQRTVPLGNGQFVNSTVVGGFTDAFGRVPWMGDAPNTVVNKVAGNCGASGTEGITLPIANGATTLSYSFNHFGARINAFTFTDQNGNVLPLTAGSTLGGVALLGVGTVNLPAGTTSVTLTVNGISNQNDANGNKLVMDQWSVDIQTNGPLTETTSSVDSSYTKNATKEIIQTTSGVSIEHTPYGSSSNKPLNP